MKISETVYLDHQATTSVFEQVLREIGPYFSEICANPHSSDHALGWISSQAVEKAAQQVGGLIGADGDEIIFTSGATESNNLALLGLAKRSVIECSTKKRIIVSSIEHKCVLAIGRILEEQFGFRVEVMPVDEKGLISLSVLESILGNDVLAVSIMAVNNEIGTIQDIRNISKVIRASGAIFHCDAAQAPIAMNMQEFAENTDLLSLSGHKMCAPKGIGALYIRRDLQEQIEPLIYGGGQQNGIRSGTTPTPLCVGMGVAAEILNSPQAKHMRSELQKRRNKFVEKLSKLAWPTSLNGPPLVYRHPGNANIIFEGFVAQDILSVLQPHLAASTGSACTSGITEPSHVLKAIGLSDEQAEASIRFSLGFDTSSEDIDRAVTLIDEALKKLS
ncbi:cysteine desulfurase family protein [Gimesia fumaroli]|uniref:cysteine desulfurase n=1 Tax=Gimesia fumaroli TaxID=2527976 RepID=A0A518I5S6_9PLAN|nr:cysteine desulfurase family protein [Gimesia fumaroli]QDV48451.1 Cysteine desulfurase [Gimesia fumaroli]